MTSVAIIVPTLDDVEHDARARAAQLCAGDVNVRLRIMQDKEPLQRYTRTVNCALHAELRAEGARGGPPFFFPLDYICLMNDDTVPGDNWLAELVWAMEQDEGLGYLAPAQPCRTEGMMDATGPTTEPQVRDIFAVPFGCVLIRREVFTDVGLLDPTFMHYCSDTDHQYRARAFGWRSAWATHVWVDRESHLPKLAGLWYQDRAEFYQRWPQMPEVAERGH